MKAWHFLPADKRLSNGDGRLVQVGKWYKVKGEVEVCHNAMHAGRTVMSALEYAPGPVICRVEMAEPVEWKSCGVICYSAGRKVLWMYDASRVLHEFACRCAEDALALSESPDPRSLEAVRVKRLWLRGEATDKELAAARAAARAATWAAWDAAWDAARAAAWDAWDAAWDAARDAQNRRLTAMIVRNRPS